MFEFGKVRKVLNFEDYEWYYSVVDVVAIITGEKDLTRARKYWNKLKSRLMRFETKRMWGESGINEIELVTKILNNCHQFRLLGKDKKLHPSDTMKPEYFESLVPFIPSRHKKVYERLLAEVVEEIRNPSLTIIY